MRRWIDYRVVMLAAFLGLLATIGFGMPVLIGLVTAAGTLVAGTVANALAPGRGRDGLPWSELTAVHAPEGTMQAELLREIAGTVERIEALSRDGQLTPAVAARAEEAAIIAGTALSTARQVAAAADRIDAAKQQLWAVGKRHEDPGVQRLHTRHDVLYARLDATSNQLLDVYGDLVETNATLATANVVGADEAQALESVPASLDDLRAIAAELETVGRRELPRSAT